MLWHQGRHFRPMAAAHLDAPSITLQGGGAQAAPSVTPTLCLRGFNTTYSSKHLFIPMGAPEAPHHQAPQHPTFVVTGYRQGQRFSCGPSLLSRKWRAGRAAAPARGTPARPSAATLQSLFLGALFQVDTNQESPAPGPRMVMFGAPLSQSSCGSCRSLRGHYRRTRILGG